MPSIIDALSAKRLIGSYSIKPNKKFKAIDRVNGRPTIVAYVDQVDRVDT